MDEHLITNDYGRNTSSRSNDPFYPYRHTSKGDVPLCALVLLTILLMKGFDATFFACFPDAIDGVSTVTHYAAYF
jgi:hypothetical protein